MERQQSGSANISPSFIAGLTALARNFSGLFLNRVELAALELSEVRGNFLRLCLIFALGIIALWFAIAYWTVLVVVVSWDVLGWKILLILAALFSLLALGFYRYARSMIRQGKLSMPTTLAELRNDRDALL